MSWLPVVDRELRVGARRQSTHWFRFAVAAALVAFGFLVLASASSSIPAHRVGRILFLWEASILLGVCLFSGVFLTADCLSQERREGTLGLLFLAQLKSYDVVLGKLASSSLQTVFAVLAAMPILGLPLLMGGTTGGEFARLLLVLLSTVLWSLALGMAVSAWGNDSRSTFVLTLGSVMLLGCVPPVLALFVSWSGGSHVLTGLLRAISPVGALILTQDGYYGSRQGGLYWVAVAILNGMSLGLLLFAALKLRTGLTEPTQQASPERGSTLWRRLRYRQESGRRRGLLEFNPFYWLASRDRLGSLLTRSSMLILGGVWACFFVAAAGPSTRSRRDNFLAVSFLICYGLHAVFKLLAAQEATRRLHQDKQSGALELLVVTPLPVRNILHGQWLAFRGQLTPVVTALLLTNVALCWLITFVNPVNMNPRDRTMFCSIFIGGAVLLVLDFIALGWVGMNEGLRRRRHHWATLSTFALVMAPTAAGVVVVLLLGLSGGIRSQETVHGLIMLWLVGSGAYAVVLAQQARWQVAQRFRRMVAGIGPVANPAGAPLAVGNRGA
jgi:hypothetical protein